MVFPLTTIKKFHVEIVFVAWLRDLSWEVKIVFFSLSFCHLICLFFDCKYNLHLPLFSLIVMAIPACTCEQVHIQHSFEFLCVVSGISVYVWLKRYLRAATRVSIFFPFSLFVFLFSSLQYHTCMFFFIPSARSLRFGSRLWKVNIDQNWNLFYHYLFQRTPVIYNFISQENMFLFTIYFH